MAERISILGIPLDNLSRQELKRRINSILIERSHRQVVTPNPEFLLMAQKDPEFFSVLRQADLSVPDGFGLRIAAWIGGSNLTRIPGSDIVTYLLKLAEAKGYRIGIVNWKDGLSSEADIAKSLSERYPNLRFQIENINREEYGTPLNRLREFKPLILLAALGAPWQDIFIYRRKRDLPSVRLAMGIGGSLDFITGKAKRAPKLFRALGFEWFWRLALHPVSKRSKKHSAEVFSSRWRFKRIFNAVVIFPLTAIRWRLRRFRYRPNVVALIINRFGEALILNRVGERDYWGLPQGGVEPGESLEKAARREVFEETGIKRIRILASFENICSYTWPKHYTNSGYKGQRQTLFIARYYGSRHAVKLSPYEHKEYKWVKLKDLLKAASPVHATNYTLFLEKYNQFQKDKNIEMNLKANHKT